MTLNKLYYLLDIANKIDTNLILPALAVASVAVLIISKAYYKIRPKFPIKVNCWFCNTNISVPYNSSNSWYCPQCDQYNGFWQDGSYNRILQDQFNEKFNRGSWCSKVKLKQNSSNGLCQFCNVNLQLKVQQLARFVPFNKENYDEEVQQYRDQLERVYRLCSRCEVVLDKTLKEKYETFVTDQNNLFNPPTCTITSEHKTKEKHPAYLYLSTLLSLGVLVSATPYEWIAQIYNHNILPEYVIEILTPIQEHVQYYFPSTVMLLTAGAIIHLLECAFMRDLTSLVYMLLWFAVLSLSYFSSPLESYTPMIIEMWIRNLPLTLEILVGNVSVNLAMTLSCLLLASNIHNVSPAKCTLIRQILASVVFFVTSLRHRKTEKNVAIIKPVYLHKFEDKTNMYKYSSPAKRRDKKSLSENIKSLHSSVSDPKSPSPVPSSPREPTPDDLGFGNLNMSTKRVTRSQTKHFQAKQFSLQPPPSIFGSKTVHLSPPKLQLDRAFETTPALTRSSSQSSGFVSYTHKCLDEYSSPSVVEEEFDSVSQIRQNTLTPYAPPPFTSPTPFLHPYTMPGSTFPPPYTVMCFNPDFNKFYQYSHMTHYQPSLNMLAFGTPSPHEKGWFEMLKNVSSSVLFLFLITSNVAILWKVFGEEFFNLKSSLSL